MLQAETRCEVADNSGAKIAYVIRVYGGSTGTGKFTRRIAGVGDKVFVSIKKALPGAEVKAGD
jgi:large subunit ribosomal protein L14